MSDGAATGPLQEANTSANPQLSATMTALQRARTIRLSSRVPVSRANETHCAPVTSQACLRIIGTEVLGLGERSPKVLQDRGQATGRDIPGLIEI